jgi:sugar/nucleoside kinase (ribokinase family)
VAKIAGFLGAKACFAGALGNDHLGQLFEKELDRAGVKLRLCRTSSPTGVCLYFKTGEETLIAASPSAALELSESDISEDAIKNARIVVVDGFMMGRSVSPNRPGLVKHILRLTKQYEKVVALDLSSAAIAGQYAQEVLQEILDYARQKTILFMNEAEAWAFCDGLYVEGIKVKGSGSPGDLSEPFSFFQSITAGKPFPVIVVKLGKHGAISFAGGNAFRAATRELIPLETTGAGDAYSAAFLTAWVHNKSLFECTDLGNKAARIILEVPGTQAEREQFKELAALLC